MGITLEQYAENQDLAAQREIPHWYKLAAELEEARQAMFAPPIPFDPLNGVQVMTLSFATKQAEHLRSVRTLVEAKQHRDAYLIARTMLEGYGRLLWALKRPEERPDLWLWYGAILDWRQLRKNEAEGIIVKPGDKAALEEFVDRHGEKCLNRKVREQRELAERNGSAYSLPDDPWGNDWTGTDLRAMFGELGEADTRIYDSAYRRSSEWVHGAQRAILIAAPNSSADPSSWGANEFTEEDWPAAALAVGLGCQALLRSLEVVNQQFSVGADERLADIRERFKNMISHSIAATD